MRTWELEEGKSTTDERGKSQWADYVSIAMDRNAAFELIHILLHQLAEADPTQTVILATLFGELTETDESEAK